MIRTVCGTVLSLCIVNILSVYITTKSTGKRDLVLFSNGCAERINSTSYEAYNYQQHRKDTLFLTQLKEVLAQQQTSSPCAKKKTAVNSGASGSFQFINCKPLHLHQCKELEPLVQEGMMSMIPYTQSANYSLGTTVLRVDDNHLQERLANCTTEMCGAAVSAIREARLQNLTTFSGVLFANAFNTDPPYTAVFHENVYVDLKSNHVHMTHWANSSCSAPSTFMIQFANCGPITPEPALTSLKKILKFDAAVVLSDDNSRGYFHITVEQLPRLLLLRDFLATDSGRTVAIVVQDHRTGRTLTKYVQQLLGPKIASRIVPVHGKRKSRWVYVRKLLLPEPTPCGFLHPAKAHDTRAVILAALDRHGASAAEKSGILVVRRRESRVIVNHDQLVDSLRRALPDECITEFDEHDLPEEGLPQWAFFHHAKVVVAPHGAGLSNMLACSSPTAIVEFMGVGKEANRCFWSLATSLGLEYHPQVGIPIGNSSNYTVDVPHVTQLVQDIVQKMNTTMDNNVR